MFSSTSELSSSAVSHAKEPGEIVYTETFFLVCLYMNVWCSYIFF